MSAYVVATWQTERWDDRCEGRPAVRGRLRRPPSDEATQALDGHDAGALRAGKSMDDVGGSAGDLLERVRREDESAARQLVELLYPLVIRIVRAHLPRGAAEEDLAQDIFLKMFARLAQYRSDAPLEHWVARIAVNHCRSAIQARRSRPEWRMADLSEAQVAALEAARAAPQDVPDPARALAARELVDLMLDSLSPPDRLLIRLLELEDRSIEEIRQITGWPAIRIRVRAFRARQRLHRRFRQLLQGHA